MWVYGVCEQRLVVLYIPAETVANHYNAKLSESGMFLVGTRIDVKGVKEVRLLVPDENPLPQLQVRGETRGLRLGRRGRPPPCQRRRNLSVSSPVCETQLKGAINFAIKNTVQVIENENKKANSKNGYVLCDV